jgi:hypothetical protein
MPITFMAVGPTGISYNPQPFAEDKKPSGLYDGLNYWSTNILMPGFAQLTSCELFLNRVLVDFKFGSELGGIPKVQKLTLINDKLLGNGVYLLSSNYDLFVKMIRDSDKYNPQQNLYYMIRDSKIYFNINISREAFNLNNVSLLKTEAIKLDGSYKTKYAVRGKQNASATIADVPKESFTADSDETIFDKYIMILGTCFFYRNTIGESKDLDMQMWMKAVEQISRQEGVASPLPDNPYRRRLDAGRTRRPFI